MINFFRKIRKKLADKTQENKCQSVLNDESQMQSNSESSFQFVDNRPEVIAHRKLQDMSNISFTKQQPMQKKKNQHRFTL